MAAERYLFRADADGYTYRQILEIRPGSVRLLTPSGRARRFARSISTLIALGFIFVFGVFVNLGAAAVGLSGLGGLLVAIPLVAFYFAGLFIILLWWDEQNLPLLSENPDASVGLDVRGVTSYGTFQEIRAQGNGRELRVAIHGSRARVDEALRFAGFATGPV